jgi:hypothetical protein
MSVLPSDDRSATIGDNADPSQSSSTNLKDRMVGKAFAILAGVAVAGWLYLIVKVLWASISWLAF